MRCGADHEFRIHGRHGGCRQKVSGQTLHALFRIQTGQERWDLLCGSLPDVLSERAYGGRIDEKRQDRIRGRISDFRGGPSHRCIRARYQGDQSQGRGSRAVDLCLGGTGQGQRSSGGLDCRRLRYAGLYRGYPCGDRSRPGTY